MLAHARRLATRASVHHGALLNANVLPASQRFLSSTGFINAPQRKPSLLRHPVVTPLAVRIYSLQSTSLYSPLLGGFQARPYARHSGRNPWDSNGGKSDWLAVAKTGALLAVGVGAVVVVASVGFGFVVFGAAGYGIYRLFFAPYRSRAPFSSVQADIDRIFNRQQRPRDDSPHSAASGHNNNDLDSLVQGLPLVVRGLVKTLFSFAGRAMKSSMARAGELRRLANDAMRANARIVAEMGSNVSISTPQNWMEYTVNGAGRVEAVFPVAGEGYAQAQITAKAAVGTNGELTLQELKYRNHRTGEVIDLLRGSNPTVGTRPKKVVEAEYVDLDNRK